MEMVDRRDAHDFVCCCLYLDLEETFSDFSDNLNITCNSNSHELDTKQQMYEEMLMYFLCLSFIYTPLGLKSNELQLVPL